MAKMFNDFVKLTDVKEIVNEVTYPLMTKLNARDSDIIS